MKQLLFLSACGLALTALAACGPTTPPTARVALDCPANQGDLKLKSIAPDKKSCDYVSEDGDQVQLRLVSVSTTYQATLAPIEQELRGLSGGEPQAASASATASDASAVAKASSEGASAAAKAARQAADDALGSVRESQRDHDNDSNGGKGDSVSIGSHGVTVGSSDGPSDHADINLPGIHISADDDKARINVGSVDVDANEGGATVRADREVRLRGEAFTRERRGFRATFILANDHLKDGWRAVGYEAGGPKTGPVTVGVFKARDRSHGVAEQVKRLVRINGGI